MAKIASPTVALSVKQPWATLILLGIKTIEIRRWSTPIRGPVYLHTGKIADDRPEGWALLPPKHRDLTELRGGIVGMVDLVECLEYRSAAAFIKDFQLHRNAPGWFQPRVMFGFRFERPEIVPFHACPGQVKFFSVKLPTKRAVRKKVVRFEK